MDLCGLAITWSTAKTARLKSPCTVRKWTRETVADPDRLHLRCTIAMNTMGGSRLFAVGPTRLPSVCATMFACWWLIPLGLPHTIHAQVTPPITASGLNTQVSKSPANSLQYDITAGTRAGSNLFHSFGEFNVPTSHIANFFNDSGLATSNILGRVTGGNPSNIFGTLQTTGFGNANLFLMNPAGILFGPTASLNVGGSVSLTTADYLRLTDGATFKAVPGSQDTSLSSAPVSAFGFLGSNPGAITVQGGQLTVSEGQDLSLIGGDITVQGGTFAQATVQPARLSAPGGQITLVSVGSPGQVSATGVENQPLEPFVNGFSRFGTISLSQGTTIDTSATKAGRIIIRGGQFIMDDASLKSITGNGHGMVTEGETASPAISITSETIALNNGTLITADTHGSAQAGDITFNVRTLTTEGDATNRLELNPNDPSTIAQNLVTSDSRSLASDAGSAGHITVQGVDGMGTAATSVTLKDTSLSTRIFGGSADSRPGAITLTTKSLLLTNDDFPDAQGIGAATMVTTSLGPAPAGDIAINVDTLRVNVNHDETPIEGAHRVFLNTPSVSAEDTAGPAGALTISGLRPETTDPASLIALNNAQLSSAVLGGTAALVPGVIRITSDTVSMTGRTVFFAFTSRSAPGSNITFNVHTFRANVKQDGTLINGHPPSSIFSVSGSDTGMAGKSGDITIAGLEFASASAQLVAVNNTEFTTTVSGGTAATNPATITLSADSLSMNNSRIRTDTNGGAPAGSIVIDTVRFQADQQTKISSTSSSEGTGGHISMTASESVTIRGGSNMTAESTGPGNAGNIVINAGNQFLSQNGSITTEANRASGGNILIQAIDSIRFINGRLSTSVQGGPDTSGGNITLDPAVVTLQNSHILAQAVQGQGGNINIIAGTFLADPTSVISASSQFGLSGAVNIQSPVSSLSGSLATLPQQPLQGQHLLRQRCAAQAGGQLSSLVIAGRDALPAEPGGWLMSPLLIADEAFTPSAQLPTSAPAESAHRTQLRSEQPVGQLGPLPQLRANDWPADCRS
jgi:filamentous hemagglutinin family protein